MLGSFFVVHRWGLEAYLSQQLCDHGTNGNIFVLQPRFFTKTFDSLFNTVLVQDGLIFDDFCWWSVLNNSDDMIYDFYIYLCNIVDGIGANNHVAPDYGETIVYSIILVDGGRII